MFFWHLLGNGARALKPYDYGRIFGKMILNYGFKAHFKHLGNL